MASKKQHAAIDFRGAANITIAGAAGDSGQVLTSGGSGAMAWDDVATGSIADGAIDTAQLASYAVSDAKIATNAILNSHITNASVTMPKLGGWKKFNVFWDNSGGTSSAGVTFDAEKLIITHDLGSAYLLMSMLDLGDHFGNGTNRYVDLNYPQAVSIEYWTTNAVRFHMDTEPSAGKQFKVAILGGE